MMTLPGITPPWDGTDTDTPKGACPVLSQPGQTGQSGTNPECPECPNRSALTRKEMETRMDEAKRQFTKAASAMLAGDHDAPTLAATAYQAIERARANLSALEGSR